MKPMPSQSPYNHNILNKTLRNIQKSIQYRPNTQLINWNRFKTTKHHIVDEGCLRGDGRASGMDTGEWDGGGSLGGGRSIGGRDVFMILF